MQNKTEGLIHKFNVSRERDPEHKHDSCRYFVLDPQHDFMARSALVYYAVLARDHGFIALADDLDEWLTKAYSDGLVEGS